MSFLKKHWRFTVPAMAVLCVLLLSVVALLYTSSETPEPTTVYTMPERSSSNTPVALNTGGINATEAVPHAEPTVTTESTADVESYESCCPEEESSLHEHASADNAIDDHHSHGVSPSPEAIEDAKKHKEWSLAYLAHEEKDMALSDGWLRLVNENAEIGKIVHNGETIDIFAVILNEPGKLGKSETLAYLKQVQSQIEENERKTASAWEQLQNWRRNAPIEPTYTSPEYTSRHE